MGKSSINGPFSMAMLNSQRVFGDVGLLLDSVRLTLNLTYYPRISKPIDVENSCVHRFSQSTTGTLSTSL